MNFYRFSISWTRVLPNGDISNINEAGLAYYEKLINACLENGIEPMVTMYHYDLPQAFASSGGLTNSPFIGHFEAYANLLFERFGKQVKYWITFNEALIFCLSSYGGGNSLIITENGVDEYLCSTNMLKSHAVVYRLYEKRFKPQFGGKIGISLNADFFYGDESDSDRALQFKVTIQTVLFGYNFVIFLTDRMVCASHIQQVRGLSVTHENGDWKL